MDQFNGGGSMQTNNSIFEEKRIKMYSNATTGKLNKFLDFFRQNKQT